MDASLVMDTDVASSSSVQKSFEIMPSAHGKEHLVYEGYRYYKKQVNKSSILWNCVTTTCKASVTTKDKEILKVGKMAHSHFPDECGIEYQRMREELRKEVERTVYSVERVVEEGYRKMLKNVNFSSNVVKYSSVKTLKNVSV